MENVLQHVHALHCRQIYMVSFSVEMMDITIVKGMLNNTHTKNLNTFYRSFIVYNLLFTCTYYPKGVLNAHYCY